MTRYGQNDRSTRFSELLGRNARALRLIGLALAVSSGLALAGSGADTIRSQDLHPSRGQSANLLPDGRWLYVGGRNAAGQVSKKVVIADEATPPLKAEATTEFELHHARAGHTATVLPDGRVFIFGGEGADGTLVQHAEILDVDKESLEILDDSALLTRKHHTATLLTQGVVLIAGGTASDGTAIADTQLWSPDTLVAEDAFVPLLAERTEHSAALRADGKGLLWGGRTGSGEPLSSGELFDPIAKAFEAVDLVSAALSVDAIGSLSVEATIPQSSATEVPVDIRVAVRASHLLDVRTVTAGTVTLVGPSGEVRGKAVAAEAGRLVFFKPEIDLWPDATYTLFLKGLRDQNDRELPVFLLTFTTKALGQHESEGADGLSAAGAIGQASDSAALGSHGAADGASALEQLAAAQEALRRQLEEEQEKGSDDAEGWEDWTPGPRHRTGQWRLFGVPGVATPAVFHNTAANLTAAAGVSAVAGRVSKLNGRPLAGVIVSLGAISTVTDPSGRFLLVGVPAGPQKLLVDASSVLTRGRNYGRHYVQVNAIKGRTVALPQDVFLARIDPSMEIAIESPTTRELALTHPLIPGMEIRIPKGTIVRDANGKIVTKISITPVPVDRAPTSVPTGFPLFFTLQPAGAVFENKDPSAVRSAKVRYPNYPGHAPGARAVFWNYDADEKGWYTYGNGTVTEDGEHVEADSDTGEYFLMPFGYSVGNRGQGPATGPVPGGCLEPNAKAGDPVDCYTGLFLHQVTDVFIKDLIPIAITRVYRPNDAVPRSFGPGTSHSYELFLDSPTGSTSAPALHLILPDGGRVIFTCVSGADCSTAQTALWEHTTTPSAFHGATIKSNNGGQPHRMLLTMRDKTVLVFEAHSPNRLIGITDRYGNTVTITRGDTVNGSGEAGRITRITGPSGRYIDFSYPPLASATCKFRLDITGPESACVGAITDNIGRTVSYEYDSAGRLWKVTDQNLQYEEYTYDTNGRLWQVFDKRRNKMVENEYYADGRVKKQTLADGAIWQFAYATIGTGDGKISETTITDPRTYVTKRYFNSAGYMVQQTVAVGEAVEQTYVYQREGTKNLLLSFIDPLNRTTQLDYDPYGRPLKITRMYATSMATSTSYTYSPEHGRLATVTDPLNHTTTFGFDGQGKLISITDPLNHTVSITRDHLGLPTEIINALGKKTTIGYQQGDLSSITAPSGITDPPNRTTNIFTDSVGRVMSVVNPVGNRSIYDYDGRDRVKKVTDALAGTTLVDYDANGNLWHVTDPRSLAPHTYLFESRNRLDTYTDPLGQAETYRYEDFLNLTKHTDRKGQITQYSYDPLNRLDTITFHDSSTIRVKWDAGNRPYEIIDSINGSIALEFNDLDRLVKETTSEGVVQYTYDAAGRRATMTVAGATPYVYTFDNANRLQTITQGAASIAKTYDDANRQKTLTLQNGVVETYDYTDAGELKSIAYAKGATSLGVITYTYDSAGRRITRVSGIDTAGLPTPVSTTSYNAANQLTQWGSQTIGYDLNGNMTSDGASTYTWNVRNQLESISVGSPAAFGYDAFGRRRTKIVAAQGTSTKVQYDGLNIVRELNPAGAQVASLWTGLGLDETFSRTDAGGTSSLLTDALNSTVSLTDSAGTKTTGYSYDAYGNTATAGPANPNSQQYAGRENDATGLYYMRARYYSPKLGRFISSDPIGLAGGVNTYAYALGNPVSFIDPYGLLVAGEFDRSSGTLTVRDLDNGDSVTVEAFSGMPGFDPLPDGTYSVTKNPRGGTTFGLFMHDGRTNDHTVVNGRVRSGFRLVNNIVSHGCITVNYNQKNNDELWGRLQNVIVNTKGQQKLRYDADGGGDDWTTITTYGTIEVVP